MTRAIPWQVLGVATVLLLGLLAVPTGAQDTGRSVPTKPSSHKKKSNVTRKASAKAHPTRRSTSSSSRGSVHVIPIRGAGRNAPAAPPIPTPQGSAPGSAPGGILPVGASVPGGTAPTLPPLPGPASTAGAAGGLISMDFRGADINNVLKFFAMATNWEIVPDPGLSGPVTIISPKQLTVDQAFQVLQAVLEVRGFSGQLEMRGNTQVLRILPLDRAVQSTRNLMAPGIGNGKPLNPNELMNQVVTEVFPIENVDASSLARDLTPLINKGASIVGSAGSNALIVTDTAANVARIGDLIGLLDRAASNNEMQRFPLTHADATEVANAINNLFGQLFPRGRPGRQPGQPQPGQPPMPQIPGQPGAPPGAVGAEARSAVVAVADTRTNSVIVVASKDNMERVQKLISDLDDPNATALDVYIRKLHYADAADVADTINSILSGTVPGRSPQTAATFGQRVFGGFGPFGFGFGGNQPQGQTVQSTDPFAKVVANVRTNSLIIMATKERMARIDELIKELDVDVPVESTTFVIPLKNAQASDMAYTLSQAFGTGTTGGPGFSPFGFFGFFPGQGGTQRRQPIQRRLGQNTSPFGRSAPITRAAPDTTASNAVAPPQDGIHGTLTQEGFVPDSQQEDGPTRQFGFPFGGRFNMNMMGPTPQYGRGMNGRYVNLLQLRQNVAVVPDIGSNSLIVTTTPDNLEAIKQIIEALDVVPRQVMIEVIIAEATLDSTQKLGFQFDAKGIGRILGTDITQSGAANFPLGSGGSTSGNIASPINPGGQYGIQAVNGRFNALVQALTSDNRVKILSTPKIFTSNNQEATIDITTNIPYQGNSFVTTFGSSATVQYLQVGVQLDVTPRITKDGLVTIDVVSTDSELLGFDTVASAPDANGRVTTTLAPRYAERTADTSVSVRDGEIVALGGLMRDNKTINVNKIPLLGDIPILGSLFRSTSSETVKSELMIFMIPHVVDGDAQNRAMVAQQAASINKIIPELKGVAPQLDPKNASRPLPPHSYNPQPEVQPQAPAPQPAPQGGDTGKKP